MARHVAKNVVAGGLADECEMQIAYAIGVAEPVGICVDTNGTNKVSEERIATAVREFFRDAKGHNRVLETPATDLPQDGLGGPLWPQRARFHLGEDGPGEGFGKGGRSLAFRFSCSKDGTDVGRCLSQAFDAEP